MSFIGMKRHRSGGTPMNLGVRMSIRKGTRFPRTLRRTPYFSSNGLPGFGGYDLFNADYDHEKE